MTKQKGRVHILTDSPIVRDCLTRIINQQPDLKIDRRWADPAGAFTKIVATAPRCLLLVFLKIGAALNVVRKIKTECPQVRIIILSKDDDEECAERVFRAGACGFVTLREPTQSILSGVRKVLAGGIYAREELIAGIIRNLSRRSRRVEPSGASPSRLSNREFEIFLLVGKGVRTSQIAQNLDLSIKTVQAFYRRIQNKMGFNRHFDLQRAAIRWEGATGDKELK